MNVVNEIKVLQRRLYELPMHLATDGVTEELPQGGVT